MQLLIERQPTPEQAGAMVCISAPVVAELLGWLHDKQEGKKTIYDDDYEDSFAEALRRLREMV